jgi:thiamine-monophosphate kinase
MKISEIGEFGLIKRFSKQFREMTPTEMTGIGDDCAVLPVSATESQLVTTDLLVENIHFLKDEISPVDLGYKSLAVNLSDIAGMGGRPEGSFVSLALPKDTEVIWVDAFFEGYHELSRESGTPLLGGDTTKSPGPAVINVAVLGRMETQHIKVRSGAKAGDLVCVTGELGDAGGGLHVILNRPPENEDTMYLRTRHNRPRPHLEEGGWLATQPGVTAMMDVSDGVDSDLRHIMGQSGLGARVHLEKLPISAPLDRVAEAQGFSARETALTGGEDYCLLVMVSKESYAGISSRFSNKFGRDLYLIGEMESSAGDLIYLDENRPTSIGEKGFDHFSRG